MKTVCTYCHKTLNPKELEDEQRISHGICRGCIEDLMAGSGQSVASFLNRFPVPIFVVADDGCVINANQQGLELVGKSLGEVSNSLGGEVFGCLYADEPGGCGETLHCRSCTIRNTVMETLTTGYPCYRVPACQDLDTLVGPRQVHFLISTEKVGNAVWLRIDAMQPGDPVLLVDDENRVRTYDEIKGNI